MKKPKTGSGRRAPSVADRNGRGRPSRRRRESRGGLFGFLFNSAMTVAFILAALLAYDAFGPGPRPPAGVEPRIDVPAGAGAALMAARLEENGFIRNRFSFRLIYLVYGQGKTFKEGEFAIPAQSSVAHIIDILTGESVLLHSVTIPEGRTSEAVIAILAQSEHLIGETPPIPPEGSLLPETYRVPRGMERADLVKRMMDDRNRLLDALWEKRDLTIPVKTKEEAIILASIVEREAADPNEMAKVAAVFTNRLRLGMRLESDPTIIYGVCAMHADRCREGRLIGAGGQPRGIRRSEIQEKNPWNTYQINGLPPTPIANPGRNAIAAVLNPPESPYLFFVAIDPVNPRAGHVFSETYEEHNKAVQKLRERERALGLRD